MSEPTPAQEHMRMKKWNDAALRLVASANEPLKIVPLNPDVQFSDLMAA